MKTILRRKDRTSIFCPPVHYHSTFIVKTKAIEVTVATTLLIVGFFIIIMTW